MADKLRRLKDKATAYFSKGRYDKALLAWQAVVEHDPKDLASRLRLGDTFRRVDQPERAIACYAEVADFYARDGLLLKAIAVCKLILEVDAEHTGTQELLAELYARKYGHPPPPPPEARKAPPPPAPEEDAFALEVGEDEGDEEEIIDLDAVGDEPIDIRDVTPPAPPPPPEQKALPVIPLFSDLEKDALVALMSRIRLRRFAPGEAVIREGEKGESFYVVAEGSLKVGRAVDGREVDLARLGEGHFFGEMALLSDAPRSATVTAETDAELLELDRPLLESLIEAHPSVDQALQRFYRQRLLANLMATSPVFRPFDRDVRRGLVERFSAVEAGPGEILVTEGQPSDGLYVVLTGEVAVTRGEGFEEKTLARLHESDVFGEMSLLERGPATATVRTLRRSMLLKLPAEAFSDLMMTHPQILEVVSELTEERTRKNAALAEASIDDEGLLLF